MLKEKQALPLKGIVPLVFLSFIYDFAFTLIMPIYPVFLLNFFKVDAYVGYYASGTALLAMIYAFLTVKVIERVKKITLLKISLVGFSLILLILPSIKTISQLIFLEIFKAFFLSAAVICTSLLIRDFTNKKNLGKAEGLYFTVTNVAWMFGPLLGGILAKAYNFDILFYFSAIFPIIGVVFLSSRNLREHNHTHSIKNNILANLKDFVKIKSLLVIFLMTMFLLFWWSALYTFIPLYIRDSGLGVNVTGWVFFLAVIPLILLEIPAGNLADKFGFKKFFIIGFFIMAFCALATYFFSSPIPILTFLILGSIGAAFVEPLREAYFFKLTSLKNELRFYPIYKTALPIGQLVGPLIFSTILLFTNTNYKALFLSLGIMMLVAALCAIFLKDLKKHK